MATGKEYYLRQGRIAYQTDDYADRPKPGWQRTAYDQGVRDERDEYAAKLRAPIKKKMHTEPIRPGIVLPNPDWLLPPVNSHLQMLNERYRRTDDAPTELRLVSSMSRVIQRWLPSFGS